MLQAGSIKLHYGSSALSLFNYLTLVSTKYFVLIQFILNRDLVETDLPPGMLLLDYIRYHAGLKGTKIGCREGDCGACTILIGEMCNGQLVYKSVTSCLMPIGNACNRHIVSIEGINGNGLTPIQQCFADEGATQCGFCTPGFIVSLTGYCMNKKVPEYGDALDSVNGNICRCTGYKSIERAVANINKILKKNAEVSLSHAIAQNMVPSYFSEIAKRLVSMQPNPDEHPPASGRIVGGGTDLYVQQHDAMIDSEIHFITGQKEGSSIRSDGDYCEVNGRATVTDLVSSNIFHGAFSGFDKYIKLISSAPIRNMATIAGNFCNASPIGDLSIFFLALNANLKISNGATYRVIALKHFYKAYKVIDLLPSEFVESVSFKLPAKDSYFNFEKVSKRTHLDIATVNTAVYLKIQEETIVDACLSAGGVGPIPLYLQAGSEFIIGRPINANVISELLSIVQKEVSPISDARGSAEYKRLLLSQLIKAHFIKFSPSLQTQSLITGLA